MQNRFFLFLFTVLFIWISARQPDPIVLKQDLLFRPAVTWKDYGLLGQVKKVELTTSYTDKTLKKSYQTLYFSDKGLLIKSTFYREDEKKDGMASFYHYQSGRLDSITTANGTGKEIFSYDQHGRLIRKDRYGKYEDNKDDVDETEEYYYNSQDYIIRSVKTGANLITECQYTAKHQIREIKSYYTDQPSEISLTEYQFKTLPDKPDIVVSKNNGKVQETQYLKYDSRNSITESITIGSDKTKTISTHRMMYDGKGNIISDTLYSADKEFSIKTQEIEYGTP